MKVLLGTTNPSKVKRFSELLSGCEVEFLTLSDLGVVSEPEETGRTPEENAVIKAVYYSRYFDRVICNDSGLYFDALALDDCRQPGLNIRSPHGERLGDDEMIEYYSSLITSLGGRVTAYYLDGVAVCNNGKIYSFMDEVAAVRASSFYMIDEPSTKRHPGWPLDSISLDKNTGRYFVDGSDAREGDTDEKIILGQYRQKLKDFLKNALGLQKRA